VATGVWVAFSSQARFGFLLVNENIFIIVVFDGVAILALNQLPK